MKNLQTIENDQTIVSNKNRLQFDNFNFSTNDILSSGKIIHFGKLPEYDLRYCLQVYDVFQKEVNLPTCSILSVIDPEFITDSDFDYIMTMAETREF